MDHTKYPKLSSKYGCWIVNNRGFLKKIDALQYASTLGTDQIFFYYHNHIWENFDRSLLGKINLSELYKQRAQQLRDQYSYLVLHFSGGSDSYNILSTFIKNKIKLNEIVVKWPKVLSEKNFYKANNSDASARNALSEWDYAIKPVLEKLSVTNPEIKITIVDYLDNFMSENIIKTIDKKLDIKNNFYSNYTTAVFFMTANIDKFDVKYNTEQTAHIFGIEKPVLSQSDDGIYFHFLDHAFDMLAINPELGVKEPFYWTPDFPILPLEQAYQTALNVIHHPKYKSLLLDKNNTTSTLRANRILKIQNKIFKEILYRDSWNFETFQAEKPNTDRSDWYYWMYEIEELKTGRLHYLDVTEDILSKLDPVMLQDSNNIGAGLRKFRTKGFKILDYI
jgi:hypothetical protein